MSAPAQSRVVFQTGAALLAFALNSILCRAALASGAIDATSFTGVRLASGALVLLALERWTRGGAGRTRLAGDWLSAAALFAYALAFSLAYGALSAGTGALILFGCVQATMLGAGLRAGERPDARLWVGLALALGGLAWLVAPGLAAPPAGGAALMAAAGVAWGIYSLRGRRAADPVASTAGNFARAAPLALIALAGAWSDAHADAFGLALALVSGAITSGLGYVVWYAALRGLSASGAALVQLGVPVVTALLGVTFLAERATLRLVLAATLVLGGIALAVARRGR
ncbi:MAG: DMT family transporter [Planctomycetes bacterium]|nr:DMT family transporter [Planctomycetota bacterium]